MARTGVYKSEVKKARDALLVQALYPSVDAVRVALGNTGSKTTIHKYLKELETEEGGGVRKAAVGDALRTLSGGWPCDCRRRPTPARPLSSASMQTRSSCMPTLKAACGASWLARAH